MADTTNNETRNLFANGGFEENPIGETGFTNTTADKVAGWSTSTGKIQIQESNFGSGNAAGDAIAELNYYTGELYQNVNITEAGTYSFSLNHSSRAPNGGTLTIMVDGEIIEVATSKKGTFQTIELDLELSEGPHEIRLIGNSGGTNYFGVTVDDISLTAKPAPVETESPTMYSEGAADNTAAEQPIVAANIDNDMVVRDGTLEFTDFNIVERATVGDQSGISDGTVSGDPFNDGLNFSDFGAFASGPNSRVDATISYKVTQTDPLTAIQQFGAQLNLAIDIDGETVTFGANGPSRDLGDIEARMVHSVYTVNEDGSQGELVGSINLDVRDPDFRDPPYESDDFLLDGSYRELMVVSRLVLDTNTTDAKLTLSVIGNTYNSGSAPGSLSGTYFCDEDHDGVDDGAANGDVDIAGKKVELFQADGVTPVTDFNGNPVPPVFTDANGNYRFDNLKPGDYVVKFEDSEAEGKSFIDQNVGDDDTIDSDANPSTGVTAPVKVYAGEETPNVDVGVEKNDPVDPGTASLGDTVWYDTNKNGVLDAGETGAAGVTVELTGAGEDGVFGNADDITRTTTTDANGKYLFDNLDAGDYKVTFGKPDGYEYTTASTAGAQDVNNDSDAGVNGMTDIINIEIGEAERDVDAGLVKDEPVDPGTASLGDTVWYDTNKNGVLDAGETGAAGVAVELTGAGEDGVFGTADDITRTTTTDANGKYLFDNLDAGDYKVTFGKPDGYEYTTASTAGAQDVNNDSDAGVNGMTDIINIEIGEAERDVDAGLVKDEPVDPGTASLGDYVWFDTDKDGIQDSGEKGAAGVKVTLAGAGADGVFGTADDISKTTTTDANGKYLFDNLNAGDYKVTFGTLAGYDFTKASTANADVNANDSDARAGGMTTTVNLSIGEAERDVDAGLINNKPIPPTNPDTVVLCEDQTETFNVLDNDGAAGLTLLSVKHENYQLDTIFQRNGGSITFDADGNVTYKGMTNYYGNDKLVYTAVDANGVQYTQTVDVTLHSASDAVTPNAVSYHPGGWSAPLTGGVWAHKYNTLYDFKIDDSADKLQQFGTYNQNVADDRDQVDTVILTGLNSNPAEAWIVYKGEKLSFANGEEYEIPFADIKAGLLQLEFNKANAAGHTLSWRYKDTGESGGECNNINESTVTTTTIKTPIAFDLNGDNKIGVTGETSSYDKSGITEMGKTVEFDIDADGDKDVIEWLSGDGDAFLFDNRDGNAINDMNGSRLFGDADGHANGYEKLAELDADGDGMLQGAELEGLQLWADNGDAVMTEDEIVLLSDVGVVAISSEMELVKDEDGRDLMQSVAQLANGEQMLTEDVWFLGM